MPAMRTCRECGPTSTLRFPKNGHVCLDCIGGQAWLRYREKRGEILAKQAAEYAADSSIKRARVDAYRCRYRERISQANYYARIKNTPAWLLKGAARRARERGIPIDITADDIHVPTHCPVLGIPIVVGARGLGTRDNAPSLDRIDPSKGYVRGNVAVISFRANRIKNDSTLEEIEAVAAYARKHSPQEKVIIS